MTKQQKLRIKAWARRRGPLALDVEWVEIINRIVWTNMHRDIRGVCAAFGEMDIDSAFVQYSAQSRFDRLAKALGGDGEAAKKVIGRLLPAGYRRARLIFHGTMHEIVSPVGRKSATAYGVFRVPKSNRCFVFMARG